MDGGGYHRQVDGLDRSAKILAACDAAHAMGEERPHRPALSRSSLEGELAREVAEGRLDREVTEAVLAVLGIRRKLEPSRPAGLSERELEVLRWVARGKTNKEIAIVLGISAKTVQHHVAHAYEKIGVYSRAGAALFVMENGLA